MKITQEEYLTWLTPEEALDLLGPKISGQVKKSEIARRLQDGLIRAVAETMAGRGQSAAYFALPKEVWRHWACQTDYDFWSVGTYEGSQSDSTGYGRTSSLDFRAYAVRFDPAGIARLASASRPAAVIPAPSAVGDASATDVNGWYGSLSEGDQALGLRALWAKAKVDLSPKSVKRKQIEPFVAGRQTGRKPG